MRVTLFGSFSIASLNYITSYFNITQDNVTMTVAIISSIIGIVTMGVKTWFDFRNKQRDLELRIKQEELELRRKEAEYEKEIGKEI